MSESQKAYHLTFLENQTQHLSVIIGTCKQYFQLLTPGTGGRVVRVGGWVKLSLSHLTLNAVKSSFFYSLESFLDSVSANGDRVYLKDSTICSELPQTDDLNVSNEVGIDTFLGYVLRNLTPLRGCKTI